MEGEFWESLNTACRLHLPVLYVVQDNGYAISVRTEDQSPAPISEMVRGFRGLAITKIDGRDYFQARHFGARAVARVRAAEGPGLIHAKVTRPYSHSAADTQSKYRTAEDLADEAAHDPIVVFEQELLKGGVVTNDDVERIRDEAKQIVQTAAKEALAAPRPDASTVLEHVYVCPPIPDEGDSYSIGGAHPQGGVSPGCMVFMISEYGGQTVLNIFMEHKFRSTTLSEDVVPWVPWIIRVFARVGSSTGSASTICSQLRMSPLRTAWALEMPPDFAYGLM